jgi:hypothetical protein
MQWIANTVVSVAGSYAADFTSIPQTFTHLQLRIFARGTQATNNNFILMQYNGDTAGADYRAHWVTG